MAPVANVVTFSLAVEYPDYPGMYEPTYDFGDALVGVMPLSDFEYFASVDELIEASENYVIPSGYLASIKNNLEIWNEYNLVGNASFNPDGGTVQDYINMLKLSNMVIDLYDITSIKCSVEDIVLSHDYFLNSSGIKVKK